MPDLDEAAIRAAIDAGVRAALAALNPHDASEVSGIVEDSYPDYDEYGADNVVAFTPPEPVATVEADDDDEISEAGSFGNVVPMAVTPAVPHAVGQDWLAAQWEREPEYVRNPPMHPHFVDMWANV